MEGLVFTVYKALKKKKAPKTSEYSSDEATKSNNNENKVDTKNSKTNCFYNINDFYPNGYNYHYAVTSPQATGSAGDFNYQNSNTLGRLKRRNSVKASNYYSSSNSSNVTSTSKNLEDDDDDINLNPMRRNWSRRLFPSCVSGI